MFQYAAYFSVVDKAKYSWYFTYCVCVFVFLSVSPTQDQNYAARKLMAAELFFKKLDLINFCLEQKKLLFEYSIIYVNHYLPNDDQF